MVHQTHRAIPFIGEGWRARLTRGCLSAAVLFVPLSAGSATETPPAPTGAVVSVSGRCTVKTGETEAAARKDQTLRPGDLIVCPPGGKLRFTLPGSGEERSVGKDKERDEYTVLAAQSTRTPPGAPGGRVTNATPQSMAPEDTRSATQRIFQGMASRSAQAPSAAASPGKDVRIVTAALTEELRAAARTAPVERCNAPLGSMYVHANSEEGAASIALPLFAAIAEESKCFRVVLAQRPEPVEAARRVALPASSAQPASADYVVSLRSSFLGSQSSGLVGKIGGRDGEPSSLVTANLQLVEGRSGAVLTQNFIIARDPRGTEAAPSPQGATLSGSRTDLVKRLALTVDEMRRAAEGSATPPKQASTTPPAASAPESQASAPAR
jgi:hypothetical protein